MTTPADLVGLVQPDQRSCGPSSLVAAHLLLDPTFRPAAFGPEVLALHRALTSATYGGRAQLPWPRALGTPPWAAARAVTTYAGTPYRTRVVRLSRPPLSAVAAAVGAGLPCPLYVGSPWLPRHVVLACAVEGDGVRVYDPARGTLELLTAGAWATGRLTATGRWTVPWFAVLPG